MAEILSVVREQRPAAVMAVLNTTPDSFSDGGQHTESKAIPRIDQLLEEGADIIDIGAESTRPGAKSVSSAEQIDRASRAVEYAASCGALVSIDTSSAAVAQEALRLGARIVNDVSCLADPNLAQVTKDADADLIIMHSRGSMTKMQGFSKVDADAYDDVISEVEDEWSDAKKRATRSGLASERIWFDPGLGFHKSAEHSAELLRNLARFSRLSAGTVLGASRKSFIAALDGSNPSRRLGGSIAACLRGVDAGAQILRVHDVHEVVQALRAYEAYAPPKGTLSSEGAPEPSCQRRQVNA